MADRTPDDPDRPPPESSEPVEPPPTGPGRGRTIFIVLLVIGLIGAGVGISIALAGGSRSKPAVAPRPHVGSLAATAASPIEVDLTWTAGGPIAQFSIYRDGILLTTISGGATTSYKDTSVKPKHNYSYSVKAQDSAGHSSTEASATITMPPPPQLSAGRLRGHWRVRERYRSENFTNIHVGQTARELWIFTPKCSTGPCAKVRLKLFRRGSHPTVLNRRGASYSGRAMDRLGRCGSAQLKENLTIRFHVTKGAYREGIWRATRIRGTIAVHGTPIAACVTGEAMLTFSARLFG